VLKCLQGATAESDTECLGRVESTGRNDMNFFANKGFRILFAILVSCCLLPAFGQVDPSIYDQEINPAYVVATTSDVEGFVPIDDPDGDGIPGESPTLAQPRKGVMGLRTMQAPIMLSGVGSGKKILFHTRLNIYWLNRTTDLRQMLTDNGYDVTVHAADEPLPSLAGYDVLAIINCIGAPSAQGNIHRPLSLAEKIAIQQFVAGGKGFFFTGDYINGDMPKYNDVAAVFGVTIANQYINYWPTGYPGGGYPQITEVPYWYAPLFDFYSYYNSSPQWAVLRRAAYSGYSWFVNPDHDIFQGINNVLVQGSAFIKPKVFGVATLRTHPTTGRPRDIPATNGYPIVSAIEHGNGRVMICGDSNFVDNDGFIQATGAGTDNLAFALNAFNWLAGAAANPTFLTVTPYPAALWLDMNGVGTGIVFKASSSASTTVIFKVKKDAQEWVLGNVPTYAEGTANAAKLSWWGRLPDGNLATAGEYLIVAEADSTTASTSFSVERTESNVVGIGDWMKASKDPAAAVPPEVKPVTCPTTGWDEMPPFPLGYFSTLSVSDPVNIVSGNYSWSSIDLTLKARLPLTLARIYNSLDGRTGPFGRGWSSPYLARLEIYPADVVFVNSDGSGVRFTKAGDAYQPPAGVDLRLGLATDTGYWTISTPQGGNWTFDEAGKVIRMARACCGRGAADAILLDYDTANRLHRVTNPAGQWIEFAYGTGDRVSLVTDSSGRTITYGYDQAGNLVSFVDSLGQTTSYAYDGDGFMTVVSQPGNRTTRVGYQDRRAVSVTDPNGAVSSFAWATATHRLTFVDLASTTHVYQFSPNWRLIGYEATGHNLAPVSKSFVSSGSALTGLTDGLGNTRAYSYGPDGLIQSETDPLGNVTTYAWDQTLHKLISKTDALGRVWRYAWCYRGNLVSETDPGGNVTSYQYDQYNNKTAIVDPLGRTTRFEYDSNGDNLIRAIDAIGGITSFTYDARGNLIKTTDQVGRESNLEYDSLDRLTKTIFPDGRFISLEYDAAGNIVTNLDNLGRKTLFTYDSGGHILSTQRPDGSVVSATFNYAGKKITETDALGRVTQFEYNNQGLLTKRVYPDNTFETFCYDAENRLIVQISELGCRTEFTYDPLGNLTSTVAPNGAKWETKYDLVGRKVEEKDPLNNVSKYQFDQLDRIIKIIRADNALELYEFDSVGNKINYTDSLGNKWAWNYDGLNRQIKSTQPNGASLTQSFNGIGQLTSITNSLGRTTKLVYDNGGRIIQKIDPLGNVWKSVYDSAGRLISSIDPLGAVTSTSYDIMDRVVGQSDPNGNLTAYEWNSVGKRVAKIDALGRRTITAYDLRDRILAESDPEGRTVSFGYDLAGRRIRLTDGANRTWRWEIDQVGRVIAEIEPMGSVSHFSFDAMSNRTSWTNARGETTRYTFDVMNQLVQVTYPDGSIATMAYDLEGRELSRSGRAGTVTKTYDSVGNLTSEAFGPWGKKWSFGFDLAGNRIHAVDPEGEQFRYRYDALNRLNALDIPGRFNEVRYSFDPAGRLVGVERPGVKTAVAFDAAGRLLEMRHERDQGAEKTVAVRKYNYDAVGKRVAMIDEENAVTAYGYDGSDWLTGVTYPDGQHVAYGYNGAGDRETEQIGSGPAIAYGYDAGGRMIARASDTFVYDADGNLVSTVENGEETRYAWTSDNRLSRVEKDIVCAKHGKKKCHQCPTTQTIAEEYLYEPESWRRLMRKSDGSEFVSIFDGDDEALEYQVIQGESDRKHPKSASLKILRQFIGGPAADDLEATRYHGRDLWYAKDALGSTIALTNRGGNVVAKIGYDAFGNLKWPGKPGHGVAPCREDELDEWLDRFENSRAFENTGFDPFHLGRHHGKILDPYLFAGRRFENFSNLYNNRNRYYNPRHGRFLSKDPIGFRSGNNLFNYANNSPILFTDPQGKWIAYPLLAYLSIYYARDSYQDILYWQNSAREVRIVNSYLDIERKILRTVPDSCRGDLLAALERLRSFLRDEIYENKSKQRHHSFPVYLGGAKSQPLTPLDYHIHVFLHSQLDRFEKGDWRRNLGAAHFNGIDPEERVGAVRRFYQGDFMGFFTWILPDFETAVDYSRPIYWAEDIPADED
jgi:RHS repeat-associated protein